MIELFFVVIIVTATGRTARGRGISPWLYGSVALVGYVLLRLGLAALIASPLLGDVPSSGAIFAFRLTAGIVPYVWLGAIYVYVRSVAGRSHAQPVGQWTCPECRWLNSASVFKCEACGHEYQTDRLTT